MGQQTIRQRARRAALEAQALRRRDRAERDRRVEGLAVQVMTALGERDAAVERAERRAGAALAAMMGEQGLTLREAAEWCGGVSVREVTRLRRLAATGTCGGQVGAAESGAAPEPRIGTSSGLDRAAVRIGADTSTIAVD